MSFQDFHHEITASSLDLGGKLNELGLIITTAESCTGGMLAGYITAISGSSAYYHQGWVTYSNSAKIENLGVSKDNLTQFGAVSEQVAADMAKGALVNSHANIAISITGIAGPEGGSLEKPVGTVFFGFAFNKIDTESVLRCDVIKQVFKGNREDVRLQACLYAINYILGKI
ncbi:CinA family protein [Thorsellia anophelis]|uniref:Nicotinamide-nucleotide amidase n=1 Tax=Thorsellia anophelis DSM 18579 TaxID=1123402 RepID=A0A1H9ZNK6_9GAMM|nr:CinA family protein [Thorsellia anophelis]SES83309.1 nicotinamide-nucleotide amidase [Thorsellia anophelis DSM 18579]